MVSIVFDLFPCAIFLTLGIHPLAGELGGGGRATDSFKTFSVAANCISLTNSFCGRHSSMSSLNVNGSSKFHNFPVP